MAIGRDRARGRRELFEGGRAILDDVMRHCHCCRRQGRSCKTEVEFEFVQVRSGKLLRTETLNSSPAFDEHSLSPALSTAHCCAAARSEQAAARAASSHTCMRSPVARFSRPGARCDHADLLPAVGLWFLTGRFAVRPTGSRATTTTPGKDSTLGQNIRPPRR